MAKISMSDEGSYERASFRWDLIEHFYKPETETFSKQDRDYFESSIGLLIGKEIRTSNIRPEWLYFYIMAAERILALTWFPMLVPREYINKEIADYQNKLGLPMSIKALGALYGPMSHSQQSVKQELVGIPSERER